MGEIQIADIPKSLIYSKARTLNDQQEVFGNEYQLLAYVVQLVLFQGKNT
jgi:hypothetical protein